MPPRRTPSGVVKRGVRQTGRFARKKGNRLVQAAKKGIKKINEKTRKQLENFENQLKNTSGSEYKKVVARIKRFLKKLNESQIAPLLREFKMIGRIMTGDAEGLTGIRRTPRAQPPRDSVLDGPVDYKPRRRSNTDSAPRSRLNPDAAPFRPRRRLNPNARPFLGATRET